MKTSGIKSIATRYVRALFDVAQAASALEAVEADMTSLAAALKDSKEFNDFLTNPLLPREVRAKSMLAILEKMKVDQVTRQFIGMLIAQKRLAILPQAAALFIEWAASARGELKAELIAAAPLKAKDIAMVGDRLGKAFGRKVNVDTRHDPALLGGVIVKIGSQQLDSSLAGKLNRLAVTLKVA